MGLPELLGPDVSGHGRTQGSALFLNSPNGRFALERFELLDPELRKSALIKPADALCKAELTTSDLDLFAGDMAPQKAALKNDSTKGVYQLSAVSRPTSDRNRAKNGGSGSLFPSIFTAADIYHFPSKHLIILFFT